MTEPRDRMTLEEYERLDQEPVHGEKITATVTDQPPVGDPPLEQDPANGVIAPPSVAELTGAAPDTPVNIDLPDVPEDTDSVRIRRALIAKMRQGQAEADHQAPHVPPERTEGMLTQLELEQAAGRRATERHIQRQRIAPPPHRKDPTEGTSVPIFRPGDFIPDPKSNPNTSARTIRG